MKAVLALLAVLTISSVSSAQYYTSANTCSAYTTCYDYSGYPIGQISCQVFGYQTVQGYGYSANQSCSWNVQPYVAVYCAGYQQVMNQYGQYVFTWQVYNQRCPGR